MSSAKETAMFLVRLSELQSQYQDSLGEKGKSHTSERRALRQHMAEASDEVLSELARREVEMNDHAMMESALHRLMAVRGSCQKEVREEARRSDTEDLIEID